MTRRTIREQLTAAVPPQLARLTYRLEPPYGKPRQGEYLITEQQWLDIVKGLESATKDQRA